MLYRPLGSTDLIVSEIGFGCASWWGRRAFSERDAIGLVHTAIEHGVTYFDTGAVYSKGHAEPRLGLALRGVDTSALIVSSKAGTRFRDGRVMRDMSLPAIEADVANSLANLGLPNLSILYLHGPSAEELTSQFVEELQTLKSRGLVRALGVNSFDPAVVRQAIQTPGVDLVMADYNLLRPERGELIALAQELGKGFVAGMPLAMGNTGGPRQIPTTPRDIWYLVRSLARHRADRGAGRIFDFINGRPDLTGPQVALAYVLAHQGVSTAVMGTTRQRHLLENLGASGSDLPEELMTRIMAAQISLRRTVSDQAG